MFKFGYSSFHIPVLRHNVLCIKRGSEITLFMIKTNLIKLHVF